MRLPSRCAVGGNLDGSESRARRGGTSWSQRLGGSVGVVRFTDLNIRPLCECVWDVREPRPTLLLPLRRTLRRTRPVFDSRERRLRRFGRTTLRVFRNEEPSLGWGRFLRPIESAD